MRKEKKGPKRLSKSLPGLSTLRVACFEVMQLWNCTRVLQGGRGEREKVGEFVNE